MFIKQLKLRKLQKEKQKKALKKLKITKSLISPVDYNNASPFQIRIKKDLKDLELPPTVTIETDRLQTENELFISIIPNEGYYTGGNFRFSVKFKETYPIEPPTVKCLNIIYHPNIDHYGNICLNVLREDWTPVMDLQTIILGLVFLFLEPNSNDPLNKHAAETMSKNINWFQSNVNLSMRGGIINGQKFDFIFI